MAETRDAVLVLAAIARCKERKPSLRPHELRAARKSFGMTQTELGEWLGLKSADPRRSIHDYEAGRRVIPGPVARAVELEIECRKLRKKGLKGVRLLLEDGGDGNLVLACDLLVPRELEARVRARIAELQAR